MKHLVLFDIDGTLLRGGPAKMAFETAMQAVFGTAGPIDGHDFSGKTDPQIARELLRLAGLDDPDIDGGLASLWEVYLGELESRLPSRPMTVLPGVPEVLQSLAGHGEVALGLLTGNILPGACLKLDLAGLLGHFPDGGSGPVGGYGSDSEIREELTALAITRAGAHWKTRFSPESVVVVGDTPRDVACGRLGGTRTVAVATGRYDEEALTRAGADAVLPDMGRLEGTLAAILP